MSVYNPIALLMCLITGIRRFIFQEKMLFLVKIITESVRRGAIYLNLMLSTANGQGVMFCEIYSQSVEPTSPLSTLYLFILFSSNLFLTDPQSSILDP